MEASGTAIAIRGKDGVVFAVEKIITSKLYEKSANRRVFSVDSHVGMTGSGLYADGELNLNKNNLVIENFNEVLLTGSNSQRSVKFRMIL